MFILVFVCNVLKLEGFQDFLDSKTFQENKPLIASNILKKI